MKRIAISLTGFICCAVYVYPSSAATLDQSQTVIDGSSVGFKGGSFRRAQTFIAGLSGEMDRVEVLIGQFSSLPPAGDPVMSLYAAPAGIPLTLLGSVSTDNGVVPVDNDIYLGNYVAFDFQPLHLDVQAGDIFAIVMDTELVDDLYFWMNKQNDPYPSGTALSQFGNGPWTPDSLVYPDLGELDHAFKTYVNEVPEPATIILATVTSLAWALRRKPTRRAAH